MEGIRFGRYASEDPEAVAVVDGARQWTRGEIASLTNGLSRALRAKGLMPGDVLAIAAPNCGDFMAVHLAATQIGLYVVPVNWHLAPPEIQYLLENSGARVIVVHERLRSAIERILPRMEKQPEIRLSIGNLAQFVSLEDFVLGYGDEALIDPVRGRLLGYTSATTGHPKGVLLPLAGADDALDQAIRIRIALGTLPCEHVVLCASMLYHGAPLEIATLAMHMGHVAIVMEVLSAEAILRLIEKHRVTIAYCAPAMFNRLLSLNHEVRSRYSTSSLRRVLHTGAACPVNVKRRMIEWWGPIFWETYGAAEGSGTIVGSADWLKHPGTVGKPIPGSRLKVLSEEGTEVPAGTVGTIYMTRFSGDRFEYLGDPEKTRSCHRGEFFTVGDVGYMNDEGFLFLSDRKIDMINLGGAKVYSAEIENVLALHPHVSDCAVFGIPDAVVGEAIVAMIQPAGGAPVERECRSDIVRFLGERVSLAKIPRFIEFVSELPRSATGKLDKRNLRQHYIAARGSVAEDTLGATRTNRENG